MLPAPPPQPQLPPMAWLKSTWSGEHEHGGVGESVAVARQVSLYATVSRKSLHKVPPELQKKVKVTLRPHVPSAAVPVQLVPERVSVMVTPAAQAQSTTVVVA